MSALVVARSDLRERIIRAVGEATQPVTYKSLLKKLRAKDESFRPEIEGAIEAGAIHRWPDQRGSQRFWNQSPDEGARAAILAAASERALRKTDLVRAAAKQVQGYPSKAMDGQVAALLAEKKLQAVPAFTSSSKLLIKAGDREAYLRAAQSFLEGKLKKAGFDAEPIATEPKRASEEALAADVPAMILEAIRRLEPVEGVPVSTLRLRKSLPQATKEDFDEAALALRRRQEVLLSMHVDPHNITAEEKALLIDGKDGTYYVAIGLR